MDAFRKILGATQRLAALDDVDEVLKGLSRLLKKTVKCSWAVIYLFDRERKDFAPARSCGLPERYLSLFNQMPLAPERIPLLKAMIKKRRHVQVVGEGGLRQLPERLQRFLQHLNLLAVPMVVRSRVIGVAIVARPRKLLQFSGDEVAILKDLVSHAALMVSHIMLFDESLDMALEMGRRIDVILMLDEINKAISSSLSHERIIETALIQIERVLQCELVTVLEEENGLLAVRTVQSATLTPAPLPQVGKAVHEASLAGLAYRRGRSYYLPRLSVKKRLAEPDCSLRAAGIESLLAIPLISKERTKGVLLLGDIQPDRLGPESAFTVEKIAAQLAVALENSRLYEEMRALFFNTVSSLANAIDAKSPWTKGHSERVMRISERIAREMGLPEPQVEKVRLAGLLHDIGKIGIIEALLEKPEMLDEEEFPPMRLHPEKGVAILEPIEQLKDILPGVLHHHEYFDGTGYPSQLAGESIPLMARIIAVADSFDAMLSNRPYKHGLALGAAIAELKRCAGSQFDPLVVGAFCRYLIRIAPNDILPEEFS